MNRFPRSPDYLNVATVRGVHPQWAKCVPKGTTQKLSLLLLYTPIFLIKRINIGNPPFNINS
ncbi:hypothetical protein V1477_020271 [Vespula maculifrons]|uniref:Uncharacterized protein n=1 Tax=Vespula maculifrons TaxID=7453 RepID=A0ABD2ALG6_VESMC